MTVPKRTKEWQPGYFYHVTFLRNLPDITRHGLRASDPAISTGSEVLEKHSRGKVFISSWETIGFWAESVAAIGEQMVREVGKPRSWASAGRELPTHFRGTLLVSDNVCTERLVPLLLRISASRCVEPDIPGWRDSRGEAFIIDPVPSDEIEVFVNRDVRWVPILRTALENFQTHLSCYEQVSRLGARIRVLSTDENPMLPSNLPMTGRE